METVCIECGDGGPWDREAAARAATEATAAAAEAAKNAVNAATDAAAQARGEGGASMIYSHHHVYIVYWYTKHPHCHGRP